MIALDTNLLVHAHRRDASLHNEAAACIKELAEGRQIWAICFHSLIEFYGVVSHERIWNSPSTPKQIENQIEAWTESHSLRVLTDSSEDLPALLKLANKTKIRGPMIHDARNANCCLCNGIQELWTVDRDFGRFPALKTRNPLV